MKNLLLVFSLITTFAFGAILGNEIGLNTIVSGTAVTATFTLISTDFAGYAMLGFDLSAFQATLGSYMRKWDKTISKIIFQDLELEKYMTKKSGIMDEWVSAGSSVDEILQPHQCGWTPKGTVSVNARINKVRQIKIDLTLSCLDDLYTSWLGFMADETKQRKDWPFVKFVVMEHVIPKIKEELDYNSYNGVYAAPTVGTAGNSIDTVDGLGTIIASEITAGNIVPIPTGVITSTNIVDRVESFIDSLPHKYSNLSAPILMSKTNERRYWRDYRNNFGGNNNYNGQNNLQVDATSVKIIGVSAMEGSDRFIHTPKGNLQVAFDKIYTPNILNVDTDKREVNIFGDFKRGYGIADLNKIFVNDQA